METRIEVIRSKVSFEFDRAKLAPVYQDRIRILHGPAVVFESRCQSVAIHHSVTWRESLAPGPFLVRLFGEQRAYANPVHEIFNAFDLEGEAIDERAMQIDAESGVQGRWLIHDDYNPATGSSYLAPWSAGCIMLPYLRHREFNAMLRSLGHVAGDEVAADLRDEG